MIRLLILWIVIYFGYRAIKSIMIGAIAQQKRDSLQQNQNNEQVIDIMVEDPECGVYFPQKNGVRAKLNGMEFFFCSNECKEKFLKKNK